MEIIARGAEAVLKRKNKHLLKDRIEKGYRLKEIDLKIRKFRTRREARLMERASRVIPVPKVFGSCERGMVVDMEFVDGKKLSECLDDFDDKRRIKVCRMIGKQVALLHNRDIIHADLTTSNMILKGDKLYFIDFGLGFIDPKIEHKAVDLHLLKQALESKHYEHFESSFKAVLQGYKKYSKEFKEIMARFNSVESRGRYKRKKK